jgi:hypothetical protein
MVIVLTGEAEGISQIKRRSNQNELEIGMRYDSLRERLFWFFVFPLNRIEVWPYGLVFLWGFALS